MRNQQRKSDNTHTRQGSILLLVLVVVMLLSYSLYSFSELSLIQYQATQSGLVELQLRQAAESGIVAATDYLKHRGIERIQTAGATSRSFRRVDIAEVRGKVSQYSIVATLPTANAAAVHHMFDESALLNLNGLPLSELERPNVRKRLTQLPGMTNQIADAILDWMDADDDPSEYGAESSWYASQNPSCQPRQGRFVSLSELLLVRGITAELLFGADTNRDGLVSADEAASFKGSTHRGWSEFLTVNSAESTTKADGSPKINLNSDDLAQLYDQLEAVFDKNTATYVVAFRMAGSVEEPGKTKQVDEAARLRERILSANSRLAAQLGTGNDEGGLNALRNSANVESQVRNGINLSSKPPHRINSLVDLIGGMVRITMADEDSLLKSPWRDDSNSIDSALRLLSAQVTITDKPQLLDRINVFQAPLEVLMTVPNMTESVARSIVRNRQRLESQNSNGPASPPTIAWLVEQGLLDIDRLKEVAPFITAEGDVFRGVAVGHIKDIHRIVGIQFLLDATYAEPRLIALHDLPPMPSFDTHGTTRQTPGSRH